MKKLGSKNDRLHLNRETINSLTSWEIQAAIGGLVTVTQGSHCTCTTGPIT